MIKEINNSVWVIIFGVLVALCAILAGALPIHASTYHVAKDGEDSTSWQKGDEPQGT